MMKYFFKSAGWVSNSSATAWKAVLRMAFCAAVLGGLAGGWGVQVASGGETCCKSCCNCCAHCGCRLVATCQVCCTTKKVVEYKYRTICDDMCVPPLTPACKKHTQCCDDCPDCCAGRCSVHEIKKLVKVPVTKEVPVRTCTVLWVCPNGCCDGGDQATPAPAAVPAAPIPVPPPAPAPKALRTSPKTTDAAPMPSDLGLARSR